MRASIPILALLAPLGAFAASLQFASVQDATILDNDTSISDGDLFSGYNNTGQERRALVQFDLTSIPAGSTINAVTFNLTSERVAGPQDFELRAVTTPWIEGTNTGAGTGGGQGTTPTPSGSVSWETPWTTSGGDFGAVLDTVSVSGWSNIVFDDPALIPLVQSWVDTPTSNNGFILIGTITDPQSVILFGGSGSTAPPSLDVTYTAIPEPKLFALAAGFAAIALAIVRRRS
ncbi:MAG: DNRLRE domain-containing protein [Verrucomicrobiota bacterium]